MRTSSSEGHHSLWTATALQPAHTVGMSVFGREPRHHSGNCTRHCSTLTFLGARTNARLAELCASHPPAIICLPEMTTAGSMSGQSRPLVTGWSAIGAVSSATRWWILPGRWMNSTWQQAPAQGQWLCGTFQRSPLTSSDFLHSMTAGLQLVTTHPLHACHAQAPPRPSPPHHVVVQVLCPVSDLCKSCVWPSPPPPGPVLFTTCCVPAHSFLHFSAC